MIHVVALIGLMLLNIATVVLQVVVVHQRNTHGYVMRNEAPEGRVAIVIKQHLLRQVISSKEVATVSKEKSTPEASDDRKLKAIKPNV